MCVALFEGLVMFIYLIDVVIIICSAVSYSSKTFPNPQKVFPELNAVLALLVLSSSSVTLLCLLYQRFRYNTKWITLKHSILALPMLAASGCVIGYDKNAYSTEEFPYRYNIVLAAGVCGVLGSACRCILLVSYCATPEHAAEEAQPILQPEA